MLDAPDKTSRRPASRSAPRSSRLHVDDQQTAIRMLANDLHQLDQSVMKAVEAGVSVELVRSARPRGGEEKLGDLLIPVVITQAGLTSSAVKNAGRCPVAAGFHHSRAPADAFGIQTCKAASDAPGRRSAGLAS